MTRVKLCFDCNTEQKYLIKSLCSKCYYILNREQILDSKKRYYHLNKSKINERNKKYYSNNKERILQQKKSYHDANKDQINSRKREYYQENKDRIVKNNLQYIIARSKIDSQYRLSRNLRTRLYLSIKGNHKSGSAVKDLGCSIPELKKHLEAQFQPGMSWDNYGDWHIDHIEPLRNFNLSNVSELKKACHYSNLQPLWAKDNLKKGCRE